MTVAFKIGEALLALGVFAFYTYLLVKSSLSHEQIETARHAAAAHECWRVGIFCPNDLPRP